MRSLIRKLVRSLLRPLVGVLSGLTLAPDQTGLSSWLKGDTAFAIQSAEGGSAATTSMSILSSDLNGHDSFDFNGTTSFMTTDLLSNRTPPYSFFLVRKGISDANFRTYVEISSDTATGMLFTKNNFDTDHINIAGSAGFDGGAVATSYEIVVATVSVLEVVTLRVAGVQEASANPTGDVGVGSEISIGRYSGGSQYWSGQITEFGIYDTELSAQQVLDLEAYLNARYGL